jgi:hypothetical protein
VSRWLSSVFRHGHERRGAADDDGAAAAAAAPPDGDAAAALPQAQALPGNGTQRTAEADAAASEVGESAQPPADDVAALASSGVDEPIAGTESAPHAPAAEAGQALSGTPGTQHADAGGEGGEHVTGAGPRAAGGDSETDTDI